MSSKKLEIKLVVNLVLLLIVFALMTNIVSLILSQKHSQGLMVKNVEKNILNWTDMVGERLDVGKPLFLSDLEELKENIGDNCLETAFLGSDGFILRGRDIDKWDMNRWLNTALKNQSRIIRVRKPNNIYLFFSNRLLIFVEPIVIEGKARGAISVVMEYQPFSHDILHEQKVVFYYSVFNLLLLTIVGFFRFNKMFISPVNKLVSKCRDYDITTGFPLISQEEGGGEYRKLSRSISSMLSRVEKGREKLEATITSLEQANLKLVAAQKEMIKTEKMAAFGRLSAGLAHEIGNPIGIIQGYLELLRGGVDEKERIDFTSRSIEELNRINSLVEQLLRTTRIDEVNESVFSVGNILEKIVDMLVVSKNTVHCSITTKLDCKNDFVVGSVEALHQVILNCLLNAIDSIREKWTRDGGTLHIFLENFEKDSEQLLRISIEDNGVGIKDSEKENIFEPFYTTKKAGEGTGLGLAVSQLIIASFKGRFVIDSVEGEGANIQIELPTSRETTI